VLVGVDPSEAAPLLDLHIKRAARRGVKAKLLIIHPRRIELTKHPGAYLPVLPGNEAALLLRIADCGPWNKQPQPQTLAARSATGTKSAIRNPASLRSGDYSPQSAIPADLKAAIDLLSSAKSPLFIYGPDASTGERGGAMVAALTNLANLLGQGDKLAYVGREANSQGCRDMGLLPDALPGQLPINDAAVRDRLGKLWGIQPPVEPGQSLSKMLAGGVKGLIVVGLDPAVEPATAQALQALDFLVVQDLFLTETARLSEVVLPSCSFAEADGTYTNLERRVQRGPESIRLVGQSQPDWAILAALAEKWQTAQAADEGRGDPAAAAQDVPDWKRKKRKARQGPTAKPWNYPNAQAVLEEIGKAAPAYAGVRWEALGEAGVQWPSTAMARAARKPENAEIAPLVAPEAGSFYLVNEGLLWDGGTLMQHAAEQVRGLIPQPFVALAPADLAALKLVDGSVVVVGASSRSVKLTLKADASVQPGTAWVPAGQPGFPAEALGAGRGEPVRVKVQVAG
jgi:predicted molibdopterin-dependent oxidoreductase YjgC